jgi:NAD(P)-dependent dehydrogenase (short-subunit alcohol dehydrogenase family)
MVTISSIVAERSVPLHSYAPGKAAVLNMTQCLAGEWGRAGIRVNTVPPGYTRTPALQAQIDAGKRDPALLEANSTLGRMVEPEEIGNAIAFLVSDDAAAITGVALPVDAGYFCAGSWHPYGGVRARN